MNETDFKYPRPTPADPRIPIVLAAVFDVSTCDPRLLLLLRGDRVSVYKRAWSMPAGFIDNKTYRMDGPNAKAALEQVEYEVAGELCLLPHHVDELKLFEEYVREGDGKQWHSFLATVLIRCPERVYHNWEHIDDMWIPVADILAALDRANFDGVIPESRTPNLLADLERLRPFMEELLRGCS